MITRIKHIIQTHKNKALVFADQGLVSGVNFTITFLLARFLGLHDFGLFALGWMIVQFVSSIQLAFIVAPLYTLYPKHSDSKQYLHAIHSIQLLFCLGVVIIGRLGIALIFEFLPEWKIEGADWVLPILASLYVLQDFYRRINIATHQSQRSLISDILAYGLQPVGVLVLNYFGILTINAAYILLGVLYLISILYNIIQMKLVVNPSQLLVALKENWNFSKYLIGTALLQWLSGNFFIITAGTLLEPVAIGIIRIAQNVVGILNVLFAAMGNIVPLKASEILSQSGDRSVLKYFKSILIQGGAITLVVLTIIAIDRDLIIDLFYGTEYLAYSNVILGFTFIYILVYLNTILGFVLRTFEMNQIFLTSYILTTVFSLLAAKPIINSWGINGVIIGLIATQLISIGYYLFSLNIKLKPLWK